MAQVPDGWLQVMRGPRPPAVKWSKAIPQSKSAVSPSRSRPGPAGGQFAGTTPSASHEQAARASGRGCGRGDREVEGSDRSIGRFDGARESTQGISSCASTCFGASSGGACGILQAFFRMCQEACGATGLASRKFCTRRVREAFGRGDHCRCTSSCLSAAVAKLLVSAVTAEEKAASLMLGWSVTKDDMSSPCMADTVGLDDMT